jgi:RHS repeat-associated protein
MTGITDKNSSGTTLVSYGYTYDAAGLVSQEARTWASGSSTDTLTYGYTNNDQLTSVTHTNTSFANESFSYDANGNQTGTGYTTSTGNEQTASPDYTYTYDADGNMITMTQTSTGDVWTYTYNFLNLMTGAVEKTSTGTILAQVTYTYDALDNRIGIDENGTQTWTLYDGSDPIMDFNSSGSLEMRYLNGPTGDLVDTVIARESAGGTIAWYLPDRLGTIRDLLNNSGSIIDHVDYSAFGTQLDESSPSNGDRMMGFAGMELDSVTGMNLAVDRVQNPGTGRWTSQDPLGFAAGDDNLSRYVGNGPTDWTDPTGLQQTASPSLPTAQHIIEISTGVISQLKKPLSTEFVDLPGAPLNPDGKPERYRGPCAVYAKCMIAALGKIKYKLHFYKLPKRFSTVWYTPPREGDGPPKRVIEVTVAAGSHIIVEVQTQTGSLFFDAGVGVDEIRNPETTAVSSGNFGDPTTGLIAGPNRGLIVSGPPGNPDKNHPLLTEVTPTPSNP